MLRTFRCLAVATIGVLAGAANGPAQVIAIKAGRIADPDRGTTATNQTILVDSGRIKAIGSNIPIPAGARVIDLSTSTISPGLVDAHTHLCMETQPARDNGSYYYTTLNDPDAMRAIEGVVNAKSMLEAGFTTVRDIGNEGNYACVQVRRAIQSGMIPGPTMLSAGRIIAPYGGQFQLQPDKRKLAEPEYFFADTRDEMVKAVRENAHYGATVIKIVIDDQPYIYSVDDIRFIKAEAARAGLRLAAHAWTGPGAHNAAEAGVHSIEHGIDMSNADLELAKKNGVALVGTEFVATMPQFGAAFATQVVDRLARAYKVGVTLVYGTDVIDRVAGKTRGEMAMTGIDPWLQAKIPPQILLQAMTTNAVRLLGVDKVRGELKVGMAADLIATPDNPLERPETLKRVLFVMKDGRVVRAPATPAEPAEPADEFLVALRQRCGQAFEGRLINPQPADSAMQGQRLVMHVRECGDTLRIPFHVGTNRSRTWVVTRTASGVRLKHDHRHEDGTEDRITQYGGDARKDGTASMMAFAADSATATLIPAARTNVWTVEITPTRFVYQLQRQGTDRRFRVEFDLTKPVAVPPAPWGSKD